jgi:oxygen-independent coproporphyrinogen-3 oxidase
VERYCALVDAGRLPVVRGFALDADDRLRAELIQQLMCHGRVAIAPLEARHGIGFADYFAAELERLAPLADDGLVRMTGAAIEVTPAGRLLLRAVAMVFDRYSAPQAARYSRLI